MSFTDVKSYMGLASRHSELMAQKNSGQVVTGAHRSSKESLTIKTNLCSTKLTQNCKLHVIL